MRAATILVWAAIASPAPAAAGVFSPQPPLDRFEGRTIVTGTDLRSRPAGLAICLTDVLVKVSGDGGLTNDPRVKAIDPVPLLAGLTYVDRFSGIPHHDDQGSSDRPFYMTARFDPVKIAATLRGLGERPYDGVRPELFTVVFMDVAKDARLLLADDAGAVQRLDAVREQADRVGMPVHVPSRPDLVDAESFEGHPMLSGTLDFDDAAHAWLGHWSMDLGADHPHDWRTSDASYDEAFRSGLVGALGVFAGHPPPVSVK